MLIHFSCIRQEDLSDLDILKNAVKDYVKDNKQFPTDLWEEIKDNHPKTFRIDQSTINLMMWACAASNNLRHGMVIVSELAKLKRGKKHIRDILHFLRFVTSSHGHILGSSLLHNGCL